MRLKVAVMTTHTTTVTLTIMAATRMNIAKAHAMKTACRQRGIDTIKRMTIPTVDTMTAAKEESRCGTSTTSSASS